MWLLGICIVLLPSIVIGRVPHKTPDGRIIGGEEVDPKHSVKYMVALLARNPHVHFCGGSLISPNYVLTAAHCLEHGHEIEVVLGVHNWTFEEPTQIRYIVGKSNFIIHESYKPPCRYPCDNDIAVIRLPESVSLNEYISTIKLSGDVITSSKKAKTYGWGCTYMDTPHNEIICSEKYHSQVLRYADVQVKAEPDYRNNYNKTNLITNVDVDGQGVCQGDSGGPLVADGVQIGINDYVYAQREKLCLAGIDGYVSVPYYLQWIKDHTDLKQTETNFPRQLQL